MYVMSEKRYEAEFSVSEARKAFSDVVTDASVRKHRVVVTRNGQPVCAVVPIEDFEWIEAMEDKADVEAYDKAKAEWEAEGRPIVSLEEIKREFGLSKADEADANLPR
jgi:prevent-host-death family protein